MESVSSRTRSSLRSVKVKVKVKAGVGETLENRSVSPRVSPISILDQYWHGPGRRAWRVGGLDGHRSQVEGGLEEDVEELLFFRKKRIMP